MPVFIVSLFLPYTVDFSNLTPPAKSLSSSLLLPNRNDSANSLFSLSRNSSVPTPSNHAKTPAADADPQEFFAQAPPSAATHILRSQDPRASLKRSESYVSEWGRGVFFGQPHSRAQSLPSQLGTDYDLPLRPINGLDRQPTLTRRKISPLQSPLRSSVSDWVVAPAERGNGGLANAVRAAVRHDMLEDVIWLGTLGFPTNALEEPLKDEIQEKLEAEFDALTVFVSDDDFNGHYQHFSKTILWPILHYQIPDHPKSKAYEDRSYQYYVNLNQAFADKIVKCYKRGDVIWINDYHLLLVPAMVRVKLPEAQIGFFLHTAFPSSEVFRCLAKRKALLEGMLGANLVAFQTREYAEHFLTTCSRLLVVEATVEGVQLEDHFVNVTSTAIGIDPVALGEAREEVGVADWIRVMQERFKGKHLIVARDKLDSVRGIKQKLLAYELFLNSYPEWQDKVVLIQIAMTSTDNPELSASITKIAARIDAQFSTLTNQPLIFLQQDIPFSQYLAFLSVADAYMVTSLREGMNLTCHEYVVCQDGNYGDKKHGPVILSEFTGSASLFGGHEISINPWDYKQCAKAIKRALEMSSSEKAHQYGCLEDIVKRKSGEDWISKLNTSLSSAYKEQYTRATMSIPRLSVSKISEVYRNTQQRVFILDYEGTLASHVAPLSLHFASPQRLEDTLNQLLGDDKNVVYVMSAQMPEELEQVFRRIPRIGIIAENGCFIRQFGNDEWIAFADLEKMTDWKNSVNSILEYYKERIDGSRIEERHCSLLFHYADATDEEAAARLSGECANHINEVCSNTKQVHAVPTTGAVLIEPLEWSKGSAATHIFDKMRRKRHYFGERAVDFLFVAGDDREDEVIFRWANKLGESGAVANVTTVSVGKRNTEAMTTLTQGTTGLLSVLGKLAQLS